MTLNEVLPSLQPQREEISTGQASQSSERPSDSQDETGGEYFEEQEAIGQENVVQLGASREV